MADAYPTLGLRFDLGEIVAAQTALASARDAYLGVGDAAQAAATAVRSAGAVQSQVASAGISGAAAATAASAESGAAQAGNYERAMSTMLGVAQSTNAAIAAFTAGRAAASEASDARVLSSARSMGAELVGVHNAAFQAIVAAEIKAAGDISASQKAQIAEAMQMEEVRQTLAYQSGQAQVRAAQQAAEQEAAITAARVAEEKAQEDALTILRIAAREEAATQTARIAAAEVATEAAALAERASAMQAFVATTVGLLQQQAAEEAAASQASTAAAAEAFAQRQAFISSTVALLQQQAVEEAATARATDAAATMAMRAAVADADAEVKLAAAEVAQARASGLTSESLAVEAAAMDKLTAATARAVAARGAQAGANATKIGADPDLASDASGLALNSQMATQAATYAARLKEVQQAEADAAKAGTALGASATETGVAITGVGIKAREAMVLIREFARGDFSRMAGSASILANAFGLMGPILAALPLIAVLAGFVAIGVAINQGSEASAKLNNALQLTSQYAGINADQFDQLTAKIANATGQGFGGVEKAMLAVVSTGQFTGDQIGYVADAAVRLGELTGVSADKMVQELSKLSGDPVKAIADLNDQWHFLTLAQYDAIAALQETGDHQGAVTLATKDLDSWTQTLTHNMGFLQTVLHDVAGAFGTLWQSIVNIGKTSPLTDQLKVAQDQLSLIQKAKASGATSISIDQGAGIDINHALFDAQSKLAQVQKQINTDPNGAVQSAGIRARQNLQTQDRGLGGDPGAAQREKDQYLQQVKDALAANPQDSVALYDQAHLDQRYKAIDKKYDRADQPKKPKATPGGGPETPDREMQANTNAIAAFNQQLDVASQFDLSPLADDASKIAKAYADALNKFTNTRNTFAKGQAEAFAASAADKERLQIAVQLSDALLKQGAAEAQKAEQTRLAIQGTRDSAAAMDAYYTGTTSLSDALQNQAEVQLATTDRQSELTIAQKYGVTSIDQISAALQQSLGLSKARADQIQNEAAAVLHLTTANNALNAAQKAIDAITAQHTAALANIKDLNDQTAAYNLGTAAVAAYATAQQAMAALTKTARPLTDDEAAGIAGGDADPRIAERQQALNDVAAQASASQLTAAAKLNSAYDQQLRTATLTVNERAVDAEVQARLAAAAQTYTAQLIAQDAAATATGVVTKEQVADAVALGQAYADQQTATIRQLALDKQRVLQAEQLKQQLEDSIRTTFIDTGKLDFTGFQTGIQKAIRQAIYDELLAKPINMVVNAVINVEQQALQQMLNQVLTGQGGAGGLFSQIANFLQPSASTNSTGMDQGLQNALADLGGDIKATTNSTAQLAANLKTGLQTAVSIGAGYEVGQTVSSLVGIKQTTATEVGGGVGTALGATAGFLLGGPIGAAIGAALGDIVGNLAGDIFGSKPSNDAAVETLDPTGTVTSLAGDKRTADTTKGVQDVSTAVAEGEAALRSAGLTLGATVQSIDFGVRDSTAIILSNGQRIETAVGDAAAAATGALQAVLATATSGDPILDALIKKMSAAGDSIQDVATAIQNYQTANTAVNNLPLAIEQYTDPNAYAIEQLQATQKTRSDQIDQYFAEGYIDPSKRDTVTAELSALDAAELQDTISKFTTGLDGATHSLADLQAEQAKIATYASGLLTGSLSPLSSQAQLAQSATTYESTLTAAQGGDYDSLDTITDVANDYLTKAAAYYGSGSGYAAIFNQVQQSLTGLSTQDMADPTVTAINTSTSSITDAISAGAASVVSAINAGSTDSTLAAAVAASVAQVLSGAGIVANDTSSVVDAVNQVNGTLVAVGNQVAGATTGAAATTASAAQVTAAITAANAGGVVGIGSGALLGLAG